VVFIDASAIIAIFEMALGAAGNGMSEPHVGDFLEPAAVRTVADKEAHAALVSFFHPGKRRGYPAQLDLDDRFAYAITNNA
jgi:uncharacterized protein with PIN domain